MGSYSPSNVKAEWLDVSSNAWEALPDYPFGMSLVLSRERNQNNELLSFEAVIETQQSQFVINVQEWNSSQKWTFLFVWWLLR